MKKTLVVEAFNHGDMSVGFFPTELKITFEGNFDMNDFLKDLNYQDNRKEFVKDLRTFLGWFDEQAMTIVLEDESFDCGNRLEIKKNGKGYKICKQNHEYC